MGKQWKQCQTLYNFWLQNHCRWWLQPWKSHLLLGRKVMTNLDSILKSRDNTLPTKVCLVKAMVFPMVMYGCESWTIKKAEHRRIDAFELWCWIRLLRVPWTARRSSQSIQKEISPEYSLEGLMLKLKLQYFGTWCKELTHWKRKWQPTPLFLPGESQGRGSLVGCHLWGCTESDMTEVTQHTRKIGEDFANQRVVHS